MRIMLHCPHPSAPSGYGNQARLNVPALQALGHEVTISAFGATYEDTVWNGIPVMTCGGRPYGQGVVAGNYRRCGAELMITLMDPWVLEPSQLAGLRVMPWCPIDTDPVSELFPLWLDRARAVGAEVYPVAMSEFGRRMLAGIGEEAPVVYHGIDTDSFRFDNEAGKAWRREMKLPAGCFLVSLVGVNNGRPPRKAFVQQLQAFRSFSDRHKKAAMYIHAEARNPEGIDLVKICLSLGLQGRIAFCDEYSRAADQFGEDYMAAMYSASDVYTQASLGEGFGICVAEAMACGTPVVATRASAQTELVPSSVGRLVSGEKYWAAHHSSWWVSPSVRELDRAYEFMYSGAAAMRKACRPWAERFDIRTTSAAWKEALDLIA